MKYLKRILFCIAIPLSLMIFPFELALRYIITGRDCFKEILAYKLIDCAFDEQ